MGEWGMEYLGLVLKCDVVHLGDGEVVKAHVDAVVEDRKVLQFGV